MNRLLNIKLFLKSEKGVFCLWILLSCIGIILQISVCSPYCLNYDTAYQYALTGKSFPEIFALLPQDYSPPLYAILLKLVSLLFGENIQIYRLLNGVILSGMLYLSFYPFRRAFGAKAGILSALLMLCSIFGLLMFNDIRPTYLAGFFVTGLMIYGWTAFFECNRRNLICFTIFAILCMYTHNIALVAAFGVYITCLLCALLSKNQKKFFAFLISGVCCVMIYLPWLFVLIHQIQNVSQHYWEGENFSVKLVKSWIFGKLFYYENNLLLSVLLEQFPKIGLILILIRYFPINLKDTNKNFRLILKHGFETIQPVLYKYLFLMMEFLMPLVIFAIINQTFHKLSTSRYFFLFTGTAIFLISILLTESHSKFICYSFSLLLIINFGICYHTFAEKINQAEEKQMIEDIQAEHPDGNIIFLHSHEWTLGIMMYFFPDATHYIYQDTWTVLTDLSVFPSEVIQIGDPENIWNYTDQFYYFPGTYSDEHVFKTGISKNTCRYKIVDTGTFVEFFTIQEIKKTEQEASS